MDKSYMEFQDVQPEYERNNRSNGLKALRCFPRCRETGHCKSGFCGTSLKCCLEVQIDKFSPPCQLDDNFWQSVTYIAEMRESLIPGLSTERFVSRQHVESQLRTRPEKFKSLIEGKPTDVRSAQCNSHSVTKTVDLEFNSHCQAWHYGWQSHKYKKQTKHCVDVLVLVENGNDGYFIAASFMSPEFEIVSTKTVQKKIEQADVVMSQALRLSRKKNDGTNASSAVRLIDSPPRANKEGINVKKKKEKKGATTDSKRETKRMKLQREQQQQQEDKEGEGEMMVEEEEEEEEEDNDKDQQSPPHGEGGEGEEEEGEEREDHRGRCRSTTVLSVQKLPKMFASLRKEDIMEL